MARYRANARVLNLNVGHEFESDDPFYEPFAQRGYLTRLAVIIEDDEDGPEGPNGGDDDGSTGDTPGAAQSGSGEGDSEGTD